MKHIQTFEGFLNEGDSAYFTNLDIKSKQILKSVNLAGTFYEALEKFGVKRIIAVVDKPQKVKEVDSYRYSSYDTAYLEKAQDGTMYIVVAIQRTGKYDKVYLEVE